MSILDKDNPLLSLDKVRKKLERNDYNTIKKKTGFSKPYISLVLKEKKTNLKIVEEALKIIEERQEKIESLNKKINLL